MSLLARAIPPRAIKGLDQEAMSAPYYSNWPGVDTSNWPGYPYAGLSTETAANYITVFQCVNVLASTFAQLPLILYRRRADEGRERATDDPLYRLFHTQPNPQMSSYTWRYLLMSHLKTWGNHYSEKVYDGLGDLQLWPIRPDRIEVSYEDGVRVYDYLSPLGQKKRMKPGSIFHVQNGSTPNGLQGVSPITAMRKTIALGVSAETYGKSVFDNGARPGTILSHPKTLSDPAQKRLAAQMDELRGSKNAGKTVVLEEGLTVHEVGFPPEDAQFMETRLLQTRFLASGFGVPPGMAGDAESRKEDDKQRLIEDTMAGEFVNFEQAVQMQVIDDESLYLEFLTDGFLRTDPKARADANAVMWEHGALSGDEWRKRENMNPLPDGLGEDYYRPANWVMLGESAQPVGGDASIPTQFGQGGPVPQPPETPAGMVDQMTRAKSVDFPKPGDPAFKQFDCPDCGKLINRFAVPGTVGYCKSCKGERTFGEMVLA